MKYPTVFFLILALAVAAQCQPNDDIPLLSAAESAKLERFRNLPAACQMSPAPENEPGTPLIICGTLLRKENRAPIRHASVMAYHTDAKGDYRQKVEGKAETSRISGTVQTDEAGRFLISTILPGKYNNKGSGGHIHLEVDGAHPKGYTFQFSRYSSEQDKRFIKGNDQFFLVDLKRDKKGRLTGFLEVEVKGYR